MKTPDYSYRVIFEAIHDENGDRTGCGIAVVENRGGISTVIASVSDVSSDAELVEKLVQNCNRFELSPEHLRDVIDDFLAGY